MNKFPLILGSQSDRRREILCFFSIPFQQVTSDFDESSIPFEGNPYEYVQLLSKGKSEALASIYPENLLLTADTVVYKGGRSYGKPNDGEELFQFLEELENDWHTVLTSLTLRYKEKVFHQTEKTRVLFNSITKANMHAYRDHLPWQDKAGGYMIQGAGSLIVKQIDGCYYNVMGLPINTLKDLLLEVDVDLWDFLKK